MRQKHVLFILVVMLLYMVGTALAEDPVTTTKTASLGDCAITAKNKVYTTTAMAEVGTNKSCSAGLDATYYYLNPYEVSPDAPSGTFTGTSRNYGGGQYGYIANFTAPTNCRSVKVVSRCSVDYGGQRWSSTLTTIR